jgi:hypothetical protein
MELEDKVISLENDLAIIKTTIKDALVKLKELMLQDHNPLGAPKLSDQRTVNDRPLIVVSS